jgi:hypothetical protein
MTTAGADEMSMQVSYIGPNDLPPSIWQCERDVESILLSIEKRFER